MIIISGSARSLPIIGCLPARFFASSGLTRRRPPAKLIALSEAAPEGLPAEPDPSTVATRLGALDTANPGLIDWDVCESIVEPGKFILLTSWRDAAAPDGAPHSGPDLRHRRVRVIRDYGMFDRAEAPQYYPPVPRVV